MRIIDLRPDNERAIKEAAALLVHFFPGPDGYPEMDEALREVHESLAPGRISRIAVEGDDLLGWIGGIEQYHGHSWELHPLVVRPDRHRQGVGSALVADLEALVRERGACTIYLGSDDVDGRTSLFGTNLYPKVLEHAADVRNIGAHPIGFYWKVGFVVVGVLPDANGPGKPDIFMAKRVGVQ